jgi:class 3 adenylate cyclase/tetratricopeptide (TPR) repeat protein
MTDGSVGTGSRRVVTILFADISGSTGLGEALDPESLQQLMARYFAEMQRIVERHGGIVEKFIGDAVLAVFGMPVTHEDDALRAVRAAAEMRTKLAELNDEFSSSWGVTVDVRAGVNTGEVLARDPGAGHSLVFGDAVNTAARFEQQAEPGEILIGEDTFQLVHRAVRAEPVGPLQLRGKPTAVPAWRLVEVLAGVPGWSRRLDSPLVDRERELAEIEGAFARVAESGACELAIVMGGAGVGKSRLTGELLTRLASRATIVQGRCLPYGEGITFWPIVSVVLDAIGMDGRASESDARRAILRLVADDGDREDGDAALICDALTSLLGFGAPAVGIQETYWAVRKLLERLAGSRPLVVVLDDIHWGEATFLDLVEYLTDWIHSAPVLLLCAARPELLEVRPGWMTGKSNASTLVLRPLSDTQVEGLIRGLVGGTDLPTEARSRIATVAEGNPLFVEETIRMLVDHGVLRSLDGRWVVAGDLSGITIPPTIHALLDARLDRLPPEERSVIERAAAVGRTFWWGAVSELSPIEQRPQIGARLQSLVRKGLIEPARSEIGREDAFRFAHILVRDAAYEGIPKSRRAQMHERLADWIAAKTRGLAGEYEEIVGHHLEQAHRSLLELGPPSARTASLADRAAQPLGAAGERAFARGDMPAAVNLFARATALLASHDARRLELLPELALALTETGEFDRLVDVARELEEAATSTGDLALQARAMVIRLWVRLFTDPEGWAAEAEREATRAIDLFRRVGDERGLARGWSLLGLVAMMNSRYGSAEEAWSQAVEHAERAGNHRDAYEGLAWVAAGIWAGPTPAEEGIRRCREILDRAQGDRKAMSTALFCQAGLAADLGRFDEAGELFGRARALLEEVALPVWLDGALAQARSLALLLEGRPAEAEEVLRRGYDTLRAIGEMSFLSTVAGILAQAVYAQDRYDEAEDFTAVSQESAGADDAYSQTFWRSVRAKCLARRGRTTEALELAGESVTLAESTDCLDLHWHTRMSQAEVLLLAGRTPEADAALHAAIRAAERKQNVVGARQAREALGNRVAPLPH